MSNKALILMLGITVLVIAGGAIGYSKMRGSVPGPGVYDEFAQCLTSKGAKFYGAFWCPHCQNQKKMFGASAKYLPYVECSTTSQTQTQVCADAKVTSYPTWEFPGGERQSGEVAMATLAEKTGCALPAIVNK